MVPGSNPPSYCLYLITTLWRPLVYWSCTGTPQVIRQLVGYRKELIPNSCRPLAETVHLWNQLNIGGEIQGYPVWNPPDSNGMIGPAMPWPPYDLSYNCHYYSFVEDAPSGSIPMPPPPSTPQAPMPGDSNPTPHTPIPPGKGGHIEELPLCCFQTVSCEDPDGTFLVWYEVPMKDGKEDWGKARPIHSAKKNGNGTCRTKNGSREYSSDFPESGLDDKYGHDGEVKNGKKIVKQCMRSNC